MNLENRFMMLTKSRPEEARKLFEQAQQDATTRSQLYQYLAGRDCKLPAPAKTPVPPSTVEGN